VAGNSHTVETMARGHTVEAMSLRRAGLAATLAAVAAVGCGPVAVRQSAPGAGERQVEPGAAPRWPDSASYALDLAYDARRFALAGTQRITFRNASATPLPAVWLRAWANAFGGCRAQRARVAVVAGGRLAARQRGCTAMQVVLDRPLAPGDSTSVTLRIRVTTPPRPDRFGRFRGAAYFGNAIPVLAVADARGWQLPPYTFAGESFYSLSSAWRVRLRAPRGLRVASTGTQTGARAGVVTLTAPRARDFMLVVGRFDVRTLRAGGLRLRRFSVPGGTSPTVARKTLSLAAYSMRRYAEWYGPYDRPEIDLVEGPREVAHGGLAMEYPELVLTPASATSIAHELAHQWFYGIVGDDQWSEPWLDESFAEFSAARLPPGRVPNRLRGCHLPDGGRVPLDSSMATMTQGGGGRYVRTVYLGGACLLRSLRTTLGATRFDDVMRRLVATHRDGVITTPEVVAALRTAAPDHGAVDRLLRRAGLLR
jgi:aminopeptidase N